MNYAFGVSVNFFSVLSRKSGCMMSCTELSDVSLSIGRLMVHCSGLQPIDYRQQA